MSSINEIAAQFEGLMPRFIIARRDDNGNMELESINCDINRGNASKLIDVMDAAFKIFNEGTLAPLRIELDPKECGGIVAIRRAAS
jgi:hypothetical protein